MGVVKNLFFFINSPVGTMWWDYLCRRIALQMPSEGAFSIFYRGCKQSNLSTQPFGLLFCCKDTQFPLHFSHVMPFFLDKKVFLTTGVLQKSFKELPYVVSSGGVDGS